MDDAPVFIARHGRDKLHRMYVSRKLLLLSERIGLLTVAASELDIAFGELPEQFTLTTARYDRVLYTRDRSAVCDGAYYSTTDMTISRPFAVEVLDQ